MKLFANLVSGVLGVGFALLCVGLWTHHDGVLIAGGFVVFIGSVVRGMVLGETGE
jgi:hypothetical protein